MRSILPVLALLLSLGILGLSGIAELGGTRSLYAAPKNPENLQSSGGKPQIPKAAPLDAGEQWVTMPAGARPAYMGIHGGTMPVSLLIAGDGGSLLSFVGRTGNDFLEAIKALKLPLPSMLNATLSSAEQGESLSHNLESWSRRPLFAGNATSSMPVISLSGERFAALVRKPGELEPFGFSAEPLSIEGAVRKPAALLPVKRQRLKLFPDYFLPRKN